MKKMQIDKIAIALCSVFFLTFCPACNGQNDTNFTEPPSTEQQLSKAVSEFQKMIGDFLGKDSSPTSKASEEIEKLFIFEYKVVDISRKSSTKELEAELQKLGLDRWECFHIESDAKFYKLFCKRRPKTYLRLIPKVF